jgi:chromosome segregation ATPase
LEGEIEALRDELHRQKNTNKPEAELLHSTWEQKRSELESNITERDNTIGELKQRLQEVQSDLEQAHQDIYNQHEVQESLNNQIQNLDPHLTENSVAALIPSFAAEAQIAELKAQIEGFQTFVCKHMAILHDVCS